MMRKRLLTVEERSDFLYEIGETMLNENGMANLFREFWAWLDAYKYLTHQFLDHIEKEIYKKSMNPKFTRLDRREE